MLPSDTGSSLPVESQRPQSASPGSIPNVLLVDDQPARLLTYESVLQGVGVACIRARSGPEALLRLLEHEFALILLDVSMPGMDGFETARAIREHPRFERTPIIFVTGVHISELDTLRGYEAGAIDYIPIPIVPEILRSKVALLVELYRRRTQLETLNRELEAARRSLEAERDQTVAASKAHFEEREQRYRAIFEHPSELTVVLEAVRSQEGAIRDWRFRDANSNALQALGLSREAVIDRLLTQVMPARAPAIASLCERVLADRTPHRYEEDEGPRRYLMCLFPIGENTIVRSGTDITAALNTYAAGAITNAISVVRDATEQKRVEAELRAREARAAALVRLGDSFRTLFEPAELAYAGAQLLGETLGVDRCGYGTIDPIAETITIERDWNVPGGRTIAGVLKFREYGTYIDELKRGETVVCSDARLDPRTRATAASLASIDVQAFVNMPITERGGVVALLYLTNRNPRQWSTEEIAFIREVAERTRVAVERRRTEKQLREADRRKDEFIAILAHELRNPLVPLRTGVELLKHTQHQDSVVDAVRPMMERQIKHIVRLIDDLLDVSRMTAGRIELQRESSQLAALLATAIDANREALTAGQIELSVNEVSPSLRVNVDPVRFSQIIANLLQNAVKFTPAGGRISIRATCAPGPSNQESLLEVVVADTGIGIARAQLSNIFELFVTADPGRTAVRGQGGLGIGLALARRLAQLHGGTLEARSEGEGQGSEFILRLPVPCVQSSGDAFVANERHALAGMRLLVVDDNRDGAEAMTLLLRQMGAEVRTENDGVAALAALHEFDPSVVLLDIGMPGMDGYQLCRLIRERRGAAVGIIALTGWGQEQDKRLTSRAGFDAHVTKPADPATLATLIARVGGLDKTSLKPSQNRL